MADDPAFAPIYQEIAAQELDRGSRPQNPPEGAVEFRGSEGARKHRDRPPDLLGHVVVHDDAAPGVGGPLGSGRLGLGDDRQRRPGQLRMGGQRQEKLPVGKGHVGDDDEIDPGFGQAVGRGQGFVGSEEAVGDDRARVDPAVGQGLVFWLPKGAVVRHELENFLYAELIRRGCLWTARKL